MNSEIHPTDQLIYAFDDLNTLKYLLDRGYDVNCESKNSSQVTIFEAVVEHKYEALKLLFEYNLDITYTDKKKRNALHIAMFYNNKEIIQLLIEKGIDVNAKDKFGNTPLWYAVYEFRDDKFEIIKLLLQHKADVKSVNKVGLSPLDFAIKKVKN